MRYLKHLNIFFLFSNTKIYVALSEAEQTLVGKEVLSPLQKVENEIVIDPYYIEDITVARAHWALMDYTGAK